MEKNFGEDWNNIISTIKTRRIQEKLDFECDGCDKQKFVSEFNESQICSYHKFCKECIAEKYRNNLYECQFCNIKGKFNPVEDTGVCSSCRETVYYVGDYLTSLCDNHTHCYNCLHKAYNEKKCSTCLLDLTEVDSKKIHQRLFGSCCCCRKELERIFLVNHCPGNIYCAVCQVDYSETGNFSLYHCLYCKENLNSYSIQLIQDFKFAMTINE